MFKGLENGQIIEKLNETETKIDQDGSIHGGMIRKSIQPVVLNKGIEE
jgi:hypothetical protein